MGFVTPSDNRERADSGERRAPQTQNDKAFASGQIAIIDTSKYLVSHVFHKYLHHLSIFNTKRKKKP